MNEPAAAPMSQLGERDYFFAPGAAPGFSFENGEDDAAGFDFSALGFFASRVLLF
jgi:hypothetical protein